MIDRRRFLLTSRAGVFIVAVILGWAAAVHAEDAVPPPRTPVGARTLADTPFQLVWPQRHLLGDWAGARPWLEERGITPTVTFVLDALGNPIGGMQQGFKQASNLRGAALAVSGTTNWVANFGVTVTFLPLLNVVGLSGAYALYSLAAVLSLPFVWGLVRETRGKTLEQM